MNDRGHGGKRAGAGRKKSGRRVGTPHCKRPELSSRHPVHVTLRLRRRFPDLRTRDWYTLIRAQMNHFLGREDFRIVHGSIQNTHLHFLVEAKHKRALTLGMQSLTIRLAHALSQSGVGKVFADRYNAVQIRTPRQARNSLAYVLNNWRRHREDFGSGKRSCAPIDPYSTAVSFTGWSKPPRFTLPAGYVPLPTSPPQTTLLRFEWKRFGLIDPFEVPGPIIW
jgi:REP element-mobilizing transposase RayT